ncbi:MAG: tRNA (adenosine(37)-N6)-threonylcarbamoyltransferase complex dimerization subunit type 1 TsaB [Candidatus Marinimicrobia bacterium]|nr:tRNA (adenosine(37)-N6)-threonylcarbamoyltransferase complex dimerization subunit type 1 TsaB [Candidatus Neomarinimicrobiota bacterium]
MKNLLGIDTSTDNCSVALITASGLFERNEVAKSAHSEKLILFIADLLNKAKINVKDLDGIGVNIGPGSFTGLRIGLSVAKGLAFPYKIPLIPVKSLPVLVRANNFENGLIYFIKSHKDMVFYHKFTNESPGLIDLNIDYGNIIEIVKKHNTPIVGNFDFFDYFNSSNQVIFPSGKALAELVVEHFEQLYILSKNEIEPYYLTSFLAKKWTGNNL